MKKVFVKIIVSVQIFAADPRSFFHSCCTLSSVSRRNALKGVGEVERPEFVIRPDWSRFLNSQQKRTWTTWSLNHVQTGERYDRVFFLKRACTVWVSCALCSVFDVDKRLLWVTVSARCVKMSGIICIICHLSLYKNRHELYSQRNKKWNKGLLGERVWFCINCKDWTNMNKQHNVWWSSLLKTHCKLYCLLRSVTCDPRSSLLFSALSFSKEMMVIKTVMISIALCLQATLNMSLFQSKYCIFAVQIMS